GRPPLRRPSPARCRPWTSCRGDGRRRHRHERPLPTPSPLRVPQSSGGGRPDRADSGGRPRRPGVEPSPAPPVVRERRGPGLRGSGPTAAMSRWLRWRQGLDRVVAAVAGLILVAPLAALAAVVRRTDPGPGLVGLPRVGRNGATFRIWKLRSMRTGATTAAAGGLPITQPGDPRVTPFGAKLRERRLDELPQLLNVVRGDMALIGPRPETPEYVDLDD